MEDIVNYLITSPTEDTMLPERNSASLQQQATEAKLNSDVHYEQVRLLYEQSPRILLISYALAIFILIIFWPVADHIELLVWFVVYMTYTTGRLSMVFLCIKSLPNTRESKKFAKTFALSNLISGCLWGSLMFFLQPSWPLIYQVMLIIIMMGICTGTIVSYGVHLYSYQALLLPILSIGIVRLLLFDDANYHLFILLFLIFGGQIFFTAKTFHKNLIVTLSSRFRERTLINELTNTNDQLGRELITRKELEQELRKSKETAEVANQAKSTFLASMSHELRTPLNAILGYEQILSNDPLVSEKQCKGLKIIREGGRHLATLIKDILDFTRLEARKLELQPELISLRSFADSIIGIVKPRARTHVTVSCVIDKNVPDAVQADEKRIRQILLNLLENAVKFTAKGSVRLKIEPCDASTNNHKHCRLRFIVEDTGSGIMPENLEVIFQPFVQFNVMDANIDGTGLGLSISQELVSLMASELKLESNPARAVVSGSSCVYPSS